MLFSDFPQTQENQMLDVLFHKEPQKGFLSSTMSAHHNANKQNVSKKSITFKEH
jgi:hypothetical protein